MRLAALFVPDAVGGASFELVPLKGKAAMIRIAISQAAFDAIAATMPLGSVGYEAQVSEKGERLTQSGGWERCRPSSRLQSALDHVARGWRGKAAYWPVRAGLLPTVAFS
jgi:hypothetical protein